MTADNTPRPLELDEPYEVSDERLAEICAMFTVEPFADLRVTPGVSREMLAWALDDLLAERDERPRGVSR